MRSFVYILASVLLLGARAGRTNLGDTAKPRKFNPSTDVPPTVQFFTADYQGSVPDVLKHLHSPADADAGSEKEGSSLSTFDDHYYQKASTALLLTPSADEDMETFVQSVQSTAADMVRHEQADKSSHIKVQATEAGRVSLLLTSTVSDTTSRDRHHRLSLELSTIHSALVDHSQSVAGLQAPAAGASPARRAAMLRKSRPARKLLSLLARACASNVAQPVTKSNSCDGGCAARQAAEHVPQLSVAYPTHSYEMDHADTARHLRSAFPEATVFARELGPPILSNPLMLVGRKTKPLYSFADGSARHRMLASASHPSHGNVTIGYDVLVRPETLSLDDTAEVVSVYCEGSSSVRVASLHPLNITAGVTILEAAKEWGCSLQGGKPAGFVADVHTVSSTILPSGLHEYVVQVEETTPFAAASILDSMVIMYPPEIDSTVDGTSTPALTHNASSRVLNLDPDCVLQHAGATGGNGYVELDCDAKTGSYGNYNFNYDRRTRSAEQARLYVFSGVQDIYFENTYAHWTTTIELRMAMYAGSSGYGLPLFEVVLRSQIGASISLKARASRATGTSTWTGLAPALPAGSFGYTLAVIPFEASATAQVVGRRAESTAANVHFETGASASASAWVGLRYTEQKRDPSDSNCYCISACGGFGQDYCFINDGCRSARPGQASTYNWKWKYCDTFPDTSNPRWEALAGGDWDMSYTPPGISSGAAGLVPGNVQYHFGAKLTLTLFRLIPFYVTIFAELNTAVSKVSRRALVASPRDDIRRSLLLQCWGASGDQEGELTFRVGDIGYDVGIDRVYFTVLGSQYTLANAASLAGGTLYRQNLLLGRLPVCENAPPTTYVAPSSTPPPSRSPSRSPSRKAIPSRSPSRIPRSSPSRTPRSEPGVSASWSSSPQPTRQAGSTRTAAASPNVVGNSGGNPVDSAGADGSSGAQGGSGSIGGNAQGKQASSDPEEGGSGGLIAGVVVGIVLVAAAVGAAVYWRSRQASNGPHSVSAAKAPGANSQQAAAAGLSPSAANNGDPVAGRMNPMHMHRAQAAARAARVEYVPAQANGANPPATGMQYAPSPANAASPPAYAPSPANAASPPATGNQPDPQNAAGAV